MLLAAVVNWESLAAVVIIVVALRVVSGVFVVSVVRCLFDSLTVIVVVIVLVIVIVVVLVLVLVCCYRD